jgi:hypothetical protein
MQHIEPYPIHAMVLRNDSVTGPFRSMHPKVTLKHVRCVYTVAGTECEAAATQAGFGIQ